MLVERQSEKIKAELVEAVRKLIEIAVREHNDDLLKLTEMVKLWLDVAMNSEGHFRSRGNWHVIGSRHSFIYSITQTRYMLYHVTLPSREALHILVFYA